MTLRGRSAIVTGSGSGLGAAVAQALAEAGAKVALLDAQANKAAEVAGRALR